MLHVRPILLVEDDEVDVMAVQRVLREFEATNELALAGNGEEALSYLKGTAKEMPCVILLDLNMPKMNGLEFLEVLRTEEAWKEIPVVVVTTSPDKQDMVRCLELGAASYVVKCSNYGEFREEMAVIQSYLAAGQPMEKLTPAPS
jgi:CheY-like chemotaxis protein